MIIKVKIPTVKTSDVCLLNTDHIMIAYKEDNGDVRICMNGFHWCTVDKAYAQVVFDAIGKSL